MHVNTFLQNLSEIYQGFHAFTTMPNDKYEYVRAGQALGKSEKNFYEENGYLVVKSLVDHDLLDQCR